ALGQPRVGDPVGEGKAAARAEYTAALGEHGGLILDVEPRLLAHAGVEGVVAEWQRGGVAADEPGRVLEPDEAAQAAGGGHAPGVEIDARHDRSQAPREEARGAAEPRADVEDPAAAADPGQPSEGLDRRQPPEMVLVEFEEVFGSERTGQPAALAEDLQDLRLVDRVPIVERDHVHGTVRSLRRYATLK